MKAFDDEEQSSFHGLSFTFPPVLACLSFPLLLLWPFTPSLAVSLHIPLLCLRLPLPPPLRQCFTEHVNGKMSMKRRLMTQRGNTQKFAEDEIGYLRVYASVALRVTVWSRLHWLVMRCWMCVLTYEHMTHITTSPCTSAVHFLRWLQRLPRENHHFFVFGFFFVKPVLMVKLTKGDRTMKTEKILVEKMVSAVVLINTGWEILKSCAEGVKVGNSCGWLMIYKCDVIINWPASGQTSSIWNIWFRHFHRYKQNRPNK